MADVKQRNNKYQARFLALSKEAKLKFVENFGDDVVVERVVNIEHSPDLVENIIAWGLTIE